jgi:hypothetical protein
MNFENKHRANKQESTNQYRNLRVDFDIGLSTIVCLLFDSLCSLFYIYLLNSWLNRGYCAKGSMSAFCTSQALFCSTLSFLWLGLRYSRANASFPSFLHPLDTPTPSWLENWLRMLHECLPFQFDTATYFFVQLNSQQMPIHIDKSISKSTRRFCYWLVDASLSPCFFSSFNIRLYPTQDTGVKAPWVPFVPTYNHSASQPP